MTAENVNLSDSVTEDDDPTDNSPRLKRQGQEGEGSEVFGSVELFWLFKV